MDAAFAGDAARVWKLLKAGADPNIVSGTGHRYRPLHRLIEHKKTIPKHSGHDATLLILLKAGADPKLRGGMEKLTALQLAAFGETRFVPILRKHLGTLDIFDAALLLDAPRVQALLKQNKKLAVSKDESGSEPIHFCAGSALHKLDKKHADASVKITQLLLDAGASPNATRLFNEVWPLPVLYDACGRSNNARVARVLLEAGAEPVDGESIYHASDEGHTECMALLDEFVPKKKMAIACTNALSGQLHWGRTSAMDWLLARGADPTVLNEHYKVNALHAAVRNGAADPVIKKLLEHGAKPQLKTPDGKSSIDLARAHKNAKVRARLLALLERV